MKKAVIFDLDGTLINSIPDIAGCMNKILEKYGLPTHPEDSYKYKTGNGVIKMVERALGEHTEYQETALKEYTEAYNRHCADDSYAYPGIADMLRGLANRGLKICVLTNKDQNQAEHVLNTYFADIPFAVVQGRVPGLALKPDPAGALKIAKDLGLGIEEIWYVGDTSMDMNCGNAAGMETVGVLWGFRPREELVSNGAKQLIAAPAEFLQLVDAE